MIGLIGLSLRNVSRKMCAMVKTKPWDSLARALSSIQIYPTITINNGIVVEYGINNGIIHAY